MSVKGVGKMNTYRRRANWMANEGRHKQEGRKKKVGKLGVLVLPTAQLSPLQSGLVGLQKAFSVELNHFQTVCRCQRSKISNVQIAYLGVRVICPLCGSNALFCSLLNVKPYISIFGSF